MKSTLYRNNQNDTKQRVNELVNPSRESQSVTLYNADSVDFLSQRCKFLHSLLQNINEIEFCVETTNLCLRPIQDLLKSGRTLLQNFTASPEEDLWTTYAGLFAEFTNQIEQIINEASYEDKNLLLGDTLSLIFEENEAYNFQVKGKDLSPLLNTLRELNSEEPQEDDQLHIAYNQMETMDRAIEALAVILKGTEAVLKSKKIFNQRLLRQTMEKLNTIKYGHQDEIGIEPPRFQSLARMIDQTHYLPGPAETSGESPEQKELADDNTFNFSGKIEPENTEQETATPENTSHTIQAPSHLNTASLPEINTEDMALRTPYRPVEEEEREKGLSSLFPLFGVGRKEKKKSGPGIRTILDRLHINESPVELEESDKEEEKLSPFGETTEVDKLCLEMLYKLDSKQIPFLEKRFHNGENTIYADALGEYLKDHKSEIKDQFASDQTLKDLMNRYEQIFHKLVKENYKTNPENRDQFIKEWLSSPYGAVYKIIFPILKAKS